MSIDTEMILEALKAYKCHPKSKFNEARRVKAVHEILEDYPAQFSAYNIKTEAKS